MINDEAPPDKDQEESGPADEGPDLGEGPDSPEPGHPVGQTQPIEGVPPAAHEEPHDIPPPPQGEEDEQESTETS